MNFPSPSKVQNSESSLLKELNPEQRKAVRATEGPVLIIAGAGTGKTRVIAYRIAYLLEKDPSLSRTEILSLTFSKKASKEMLERVESLVDISGPDELQVFTFHGFCHRFLQDHALDVGLPTSFKLLDRVESWIFCRRLLPELKLTYFWNLSDPTDCLHGFLRFMSRAKDELVSPEDYASFAAALKDPRERAKAEEMARVYAHYQKKMKEEGFLDFGDLLVETFHGFKKNPALLTEFQTRYRYIVVDEFQDTNVAQISILSLLAEQSGNLCVVGDDDQAIYRFRGASFASFLLMKRSFPQMKTLRLTQNYRSTQIILSATNRLIQNNQSDRFDPEKSLWTDNPRGCPVQVIVCANEQQESLSAIEAIQTICEKEGSGARFDQIAVLYRAHAHARHLLEVLKNCSIPFTVVGGISLFDQPEIKDLLSYCRFLQNPTDSVSLFHSLSHPIWGIPLEELLVLSHFSKERSISLFKTLQHLQELSIDSGTYPKIESFLQEAAVCRKQALRFGVGKWIPKMIEEKSIGLLFKLDQPGGNQLVSLGRFLNFIYRYTETHPRNQDLSSFLWHLDSYLLAGEEPAQEEDDSGPANSVRLMTIHQAKGLEFDWVILLGMVQGRFPSRGRPEPIPFPIELMKEPLPEGDYHLQEERRLCYVAATRARRGLLLMTQERAYHRPSTFLLEMKKQSTSDEFSHALKKAEGPPLHSLADVVDPSRRISLSAEREAFQILRKLRSSGSSAHEKLPESIQQMTELMTHLHRETEKLSVVLKPAIAPSAKFSYSQLETYRYCPLKYKYSYIYKIPTRPTAQMAFGVDLHACLESFYQKVMNGQVPSQKDLLEIFRQIHTPGRYGEPYLDEQYLRLGSEMLTGFYQKQEGSFTTPLFLEKTFFLSIGENGIRGVIDRIDPLPDKGVEIIDYKSGKPKEDADINEQLQLRLYALACRELFQLEPRRISFYYLKNNQKLSFEHKESDFNQTKNQLTEQIAAIRSGDFTPSPSPRKCRRCDFQNLCPASMA